VISFLTAADVAKLRDEVRRQASAMRDAMSSATTSAELLGRVSVPEFSTSPLARRVEERLALARQVEDTLSAMIDTFVSGQEKIDAQPELFDTAPFASKAPQTAEHLI
jgi:hypothetical protein